MNTDLFLSFVACAFFCPNDRFVNLASGELPHHRKASNPHHEGLRCHASRLIWRVVLLVTIYFLAVEQNYKNIHNVPASATIKSLKWSMKSMLPDYCHFCTHHKSSSGCYNPEQKEFVAPATVNIEKRHFNMQIAAHDNR